MDKFGQAESLQGIGITLLQPLSNKVHSLNAVRKTLREVKLSHNGREKGAFCRIYLYRIIYPG
jgi:hypothetical protein